MCGKYFVNEDYFKKQYLSKIEKHYQQQQLDLWKLNDVYPKDIVLTVDNKRFQLMKWQYHLFDRNIHNSRIESIIDKDYYMSDYHNNKCLILASGFYEFDRNKNEYYFKTNDEVLYLAGLYQKINDLNHCSIITTQAEQSKLIHQRIPIVLNQQQAREYLLNKIPLDTLANIKPYFDIERSNDEN